jgi:hypothetical protein
MRLLSATLETLHIAFSEQPDESAADEEIDNTINKNRVGLGSGRP